MEEFYVFSRYNLVQLLVKIHVMIPQETEMKKDKFKFRAFTALVVLWSFIVENVTGIVLYIVPPGRIAHWTNWKLWGFTKDQWAALHTIFGYIFLIFAVIHIYYNWKPIMNYLKQKIKYGLRVRKELAVSLIITILVFVATAVSIPPFSTVMDFGEKMKNSWEESRQEPFVPHAELMSFEEFIGQAGISKERTKKIFEDNGIKIQDTSSLIRDIAKDNNTSPAALYEILKSDLPTQDREKLESLTAQKKQPAGGGYGWKTLENLAQELSISVQDIMKFLQSKGIDAKKDDVIRSVAEKHGLKAYELVDMIRKMQE
jgi:hypothetical protein